MRMDNTPVEVKPKIQLTDKNQAEMLERGWPLRRPVAVGGLLLAIAGFLIWLPGEQRGEIWIAVLAQRSLMLAVAAFTLLSLSLLWARGQKIDNAIFRFINLWGFRPKWLDHTMFAITQLGGGWAAMVLAFLLLLNSQRNLAFEIILGTLTLGLLVEGLKETMNRARPFLVNVEARIIGWRPPGRSFPSGHTSQAFFLMTLLNFQLHAPLPVTIVFYAVAVMVGITRMYVGAHFPRDVVGGMILGLAWGTFLILIDPYWHAWFAF